MRTKSIFASSLIVLAFVAHAHALSAAEAPLIRAPEAKQEEFTAFAKANSRRTLTETLDLTRPGQDSEQKLNRLVAKAQEAWLGGSPESARSVFQQITFLALEADWRPAQQEAIHYAFMRLAQITSVPTEREAWLSQAAILFPAVEPDRGLFPPPLLENYQAAKSRALAQAREFVPSRLFPDYQVILINGRRHEITPELHVRIPSGTHRITALSDSHPPITERLTTSQLEIFRAQVEPLVSGTCDDPHVGSSSPRATGARAENVEVFFNPDCVRVRKGEAWVSRDADVADLQRFSATLARPLPPKSGELNLPWTNETRPSTKISASTRNWIWVGATALALGAAYAIHREHARETTVQPVHREGF